MTSELALFGTRPGSRNEPPIFSWDLSVAYRQENRALRGLSRACANAHYTAKIANGWNIVKYHDMNRETFIAKLTEIQESAGQLLSQLQARA